MTRRRRAFTLLETVLAAAIASVVALSALGLFMTIDKTDAMLAGPLSVLAFAGLLAKRIAVEERALHATAAPRASD